MDSSTVKKYGLDKVALLGLFALGLLMAHVIVASRSRVQLIEAPEIARSGLTVLVPAGGGWQNDKGWEFQDNSFVLTRRFGPAVVQVKYLLAPLKISSDVWLEQKQAELGGVLLESGQIPLGQFEISWAHICDEQGLLDVFFGVAQLPQGRGLSIEVKEGMGGRALGERLFEKMAQGIGFEDNQLLQKGRLLVERVKSQGFYNLIGPPAAEREEFFLVKNLRKRIIGFSGTMLKALVGDKGQEQVRAVDFYHISEWGEAGGWHSLFESDENITAFRWVSRASSSWRGEQAGVRMELSADGVLSVAGLAGPVTGRYSPGPAAVPEVLLERVISVLLETGGGEMMVDLILPQGQIVPTLVSEIDVKQSDDGNTAAAYAVRLDFLDGRDYYEESYLDSNKKIFKALVQRQEAYVIERSSRDEVLKRFPSWRDYISQMARILQRPDVDGPRRPRSVNYDDTNI